MIEPSNNYAFASSVNAVPLVAVEIQPAAAEFAVVFATSADQQTLTLCIDETCPGFNREGRGQRLFGEDGKPSPYVEHVLKFLQEYQAQFARTRRFCGQLKDLNLLEPMQAMVTTPTGTKQSLGGFLGVKRERLRELGGETLSMLARTDELELLYLHLHSLRNFNEMTDRFNGTQAFGVDTKDWRPGPELNRRPTA